MNARERIKEAALKVFAEKTFEGSRIDEIARAANAPKSLIYYHFKNKEEILTALTDDFVEEYQNIIGTVPDETHREKAGALPERMRTIYYAFGQRHADLIRVLMIESLKKSTKEPVFYRIIDALIRKDQQKDPAGDADERRVAEFFTSFLPNALYLCFAQSFGDYFDIEPARLGSLFLRVYEETHGAYHKNHE